MEAAKNVFIEFLSEQKSTPQLAEQVLQHLHVLEQLDPSEELLQLISRLKDCSDSRVSEKATQVEQAWKSNPKKRKREESDEDSFSSLAKKSKTDIELKTSANFSSSFLPSKFNECLHHELLQRILVTFRQLHNPHCGRINKDRKEMHIRCWGFSLNDHTEHINDASIKLTFMNNDPQEWCKTGSFLSPERDADAVIIAIAEDQLCPLPVKDDAWTQLTTITPGRKKIVDLIEQIFRWTPCRVLCFLVPSSYITTIAPFDPELLPVDVFRSASDPSHSCVIIQNLRRISVQSRQQFATLFKYHEREPSINILRQILSTGVAITAKEGTPWRESEAKASELYNMVKDMACSADPNVSDDKAIYEALRKQVHPVEKKKEEASLSVFDDNTLKKRASNRVRQIFQELPLDPQLKYKVLRNDDRRRGNRKDDNVEFTSSWRPRSLLDVGCGEGSITKELGQALELSEDNIHGCDIRTLPTVDHIKYQRIGASQPLPYDNESMDLVTAFMTLHHIEDQVAAIREMWRVLKPGGYLLIREHDASLGKYTDEPFSMALDIMHGGYSIVWSNPMEDETYLETYFARYRGREEWRAMIERVGFKLVHKPGRDDGPRGRRDNHYKFYYDTFVKPLPILGR